MDKETLEIVKMLEPYWKAIKDDEDPRYIYCDSCEWNHPVSSECYVGRLDEKFLDA